MRTFVRFAFAVILLLPAIGPTGQELADARHLLFVADAREPFIDVLDMRRDVVIDRLETAHVVDDLAVPANAPLLIYTSIAERRVTVYDLSTRQVRHTVTLPIAPRHMVMNARGDRIAFTDSADGGFVLLGTFNAAVQMSLIDLAPTGDVLFDPNDVDIYYSNSRDGTLGLIDTNTKTAVEISIATPGEALSSPSRSLDARHVYVANEKTAEVYALNAFSRIVYRTFELGVAPARPYTTPEGSFLYLLGKDDGRLTSIEQFNFDPYATTVLGSGVDLVAVGRFDRMNLFASTSGRTFHLYDNVTRSKIESATFDFTPLDVQGSADGRKAYIAFRDGPAIAVVDLERRTLRYVAATSNGARAFALGRTNNVCH